MRIWMSFLLWLGSIILNRRLRSIMKECLRRCMCLLKVMLCAYLIYIAYRTWETGVSACVRFEPHGERSERRLTARLDIVKPEKAR